MSFFITKERDRHKGRVGFAAHALIERLQYFPLKFSGDFPDTFGFGCIANFP